MLIELILNQCMLLLGIQIPGLAEALAFQPP